MSSWGAVILQDMLNFTVKLFTWMTGKRSQQTGVVWEAISRGSWVPSSSQRATIGPQTENLSVPKSCICYTFCPLAQQNQSLLFQSTSHIYQFHTQEEQQISFNIPVESKKNMAWWGAGMYFIGIFSSFWMCMLGQLEHWNPSYSFQRELTMKLNLHSGVHLKQFHLTEMPLYWARMCHKLDQFGWAVTAVVVPLTLLNWFFSRDWHWSIYNKLAIWTQINIWTIKQVDIEMLRIFKILWGISYPLIHKTISLNSIQYRYKSDCKTFWNRND